MIHYEFLPEHRLIFNVFHGKVSSGELLQHARQLSAHDYQGINVSGLSILTKDLSINDIKVSDISACAHLIRGANFRMGGKNAILSYSSLSYAFARVYQTVLNLEKIDETRVYRKHELNHALSWLKLEALTEEIQSKVEQYEKATQ